jgi:hypothetical protein
MNKLTLRKLVSIGAVICVMLVFQNCAGGFQSSPLLNAESETPGSGNNPGTVVAGTLKIQLSWNPPSNGMPAGYYIQQSTDGTNFTQVLQVSGSITNATVSNLSPAKYYFKVISYSQVAESSSQVMTADLTAN